MEREREKVKGGATRPRGMRRESLIRNGIANIASKREFQGLGIVQHRATGEGWRVKGGEWRVEGQRRRGCVAGTRVVHLYSNLGINFAIINRVGIIYGDSPCFIVFWVGYFLRIPKWLPMVHVSPFDMVSFILFFYSGNNQKGDIDEEVKSLRVVTSSRKFYSRKCRYV